MKTLFLKTILSLLAVALAMALAIYIPARDLSWTAGWIYLGIYLGGGLLICVYLIRKDPALLQRRLRGGPAAEKRPAQKIIMSFASIGFAALLIIPGFDHRFGWFTAPLAVLLVGDALTALGLYFTYRVYSANTFAAATIAIATDQVVISTGPYAVIRHPMYASALPYVIGTPLALGSYWGLLAVVFMAPALIWRILDEEELLEKDLPGYQAYQQKVRYRLLPYVW